MNLTSKARRVRRIAVTLVMATVAIMVLVGGPSGTSSQPADAAMPTGLLDVCPDFLKADSAPPAAAYRAGVESMVGNVGPYGHESRGFNAASKPYGKTPITLFEDLGSSGLRWTRYDKGCGSALAGGMQNLVANQLFGFSTAITSITISMYSWATDPDLLKSFLKPVECVVKGCAGPAYQPDASGLGGDQGFKSGGLAGALYLNFLVPILVLGALWTAWHGIVKRSSTTAWQGGLWMCCSAAFAVVFMANPVLIAQTGNSIVSNINAKTANAITGAASAALPQGDPCRLDKPDTAKDPKPGSAEAQRVSDYGVRVSSCSIWNSMALQPWAAGQFGVAPGISLPDTKNATSDGCMLNGVRQTDMRVTQLCSQTVSHDEAMASAAKHGAVANAVGKVFTGVFGSPESTTTAKAQMWQNIADQQGEGSSWAGADAGYRVNIAFSSIIASIAVGFIVIVISFSNVVLALGFVLLLMFAPIALLAGAHPGIGRGIGLKWLELLISTVVKRIILGLMLAILIGMYQIIIAADMALFSKTFLLVAVGVAGMIYRKPLMETLNIVNLGGTQTGLESGGKEALQKGANMATGAGAGGIGAAFAGGGVGAVLGSMAGGAARSANGSNPAVQAGRQGHATGSRRGAKSAAARAARRTPEQPAGSAPDCPSCGKPLVGSRCNNPTCPSRGGGGNGNGGGGTPRPNGGNGGNGGGTPAPAVPAPTAPVVPAPTAPRTAGTVQPTPRPDPGTQAPATQVTRPPASQAPAPVVSPVTPATVVSAPATSAGSGGTLPTRPGDRNPGGLDHAQETSAAVVVAQRNADRGGNADGLPPRPKK